MKGYELAEYLSFDVEAYLRDQIQRSDETVKIIKESGNWDEHTELIHRHFHAICEIELKSFEEASPEIKRGMSHRFLNYIQIIKPFPEAFKVSAPENSRMTANDVEEQQRKERERPRLRTDNPPQSWIEKSEDLKFAAYVLAGMCLIAFILSLIFAFINIYLMIASFAIAVGLGVFSYKTFVQSRKSQQKWEMMYHTIVYNPLLKSGKNATVEIQLELPVGWSTPETLSRLENCAKPSLYELFARSDTVPLRSNVFDCIERQLALKQDELALAICRMQLLKNFDPEMPPFGAEQIYRTADALVTYEIADLWRVSAVNRKISEILLSHPADELIEFSKALNIHIIDVKKRTVTDSNEKYSDW